MADVFLSYARANREMAERLAAALEAQGHSAWWDRRIIGGSEFSTDIERELDAAQAVIVAWSAEANQSHWVKDEAAVGRDQGKLIPISLGGVRPPLGFRQYHAIDFSAWDGTVESVEFTELRQALAARMEGEPPREAGPTGRRSARKAWPLSRRTGAAVLLLVASVLAATLFLRGAGGPETASRPQEASTDPRIAVQPIKVSGSSAELNDFGAALSEDIASGLARFSHLQVITGFDSGTPGGDVDHPAYVLEGSLRRAGDTLRLSAQLFKTASGAQVWGETFDRDFDADALLTVQDDLTDHVVASVADSYGALMRDLAAPVVLKTPQEMTPYEAVLRNLIYRQRLGAEDHLLTRAALQRAVEIAPGNANVWSALAGVYTEEYKHDYNVLPGSLDRALAAARRAVELEPDNAYANFILAEVHYFRQDPGAFQAAAEHAIALNPRDSDAMAMIGILMGYGGEWQRGVELTRRAMALNPNHPGWYRFSTYFDAFRQERYAEALDIAQRVNLPAYFPDPYTRAIAHAGLGHEREARQAAREFLALWPEGDLAAFSEKHLGRWFYAQPELAAAVIEGLERAGLDFDQGD
jgi:TolB-like protein